MDKAIRFYWCGGEATLPFAALAEADRQPLQVRLSVLREHVPAVVEQLEQGRYVAAAWPSGGQMLMIACHPNLARRPVDTACLDARSLPQVVLRLRSWDEAREAAQLLLAAFGGEVIDTQEGRVARLALIDWLQEREQERTAEVVRRYLMYPIYPLGPSSRVGLRTAAAMKALADVARGQWPLPESAVPAWRRFVIRACREDVAFDPDELTRWFEVSGWDARAADALTRQFMDDAAFLDEYEEEARPA